MDCFPLLITNKDIDILKARKSEELSEPYQFICYEGVLCLHRGFLKSSIDNPW